jgi:hypothetical protein
MPRALALCFTIVAAFHTQLVAAAPLTPVAVTTPVAALAERLGMDVVRDRGRFVAEIIRRIYAPAANHQIQLNLVPGPRVPGEPALADATRAADPGALVVVDVPMTAAFWSEHIFKRQIPESQLLAWVLTDRRAALVCRGLLAADAETLAYYGEHPGLVAFIYEHAPGAFSAFADSVRVRGGRLVVPGGPIAETLWQGMLRASANEPDAFLRALLFEPEARFAYLFDVLATASPEARAFALGLWIDDGSFRAQRFQALGLEVHSGFREWHVEDLPFSRPLNDLGILLLRIGANQNGEPTRPALRRFWADALGVSPALAAASTSPPTHVLIDAAWLVQATSGDMYTRGDKLDQLAFGQRVFRSHKDGESDVAAAVIREMSTRRMLLLGLERIGVTDPAVYSSGLRQAHDALEGGAERFWTVSQHQAAFALIVRMVLVGSLSARDGEALAKSLFAVPIAAGEFKGGLAEWFQRVLGEKLPAGETWRERATAGAAGGRTPGNPQIEWEGQSYRLDLAFAERRRIDAVQTRQSGPDLDTAFAVSRLGRRAAQATSIDAVRPLVAETQALLAASGAMLARPAVNPLPPGVAPRRDGREWLARTADEFDRAVRANDVRRAVRAGESLVDLGDIATTHALLSLIYAIHLGDPNGPALLGANVALRHDFGFARRDREGRARGPWAQPRQDFQPGVPWHVVGSLVGLDVALAPLGLHRISMEGLALPPRLQSIEREAFATNVALLNARRLGDIDRDRIVAAIARGRARLKALRVDSPEFDRLRDEIVLDGWRTRTLAWMLQNEPDSVENQLSLAELLVLGEPDSASDAWGANGQLPFGCVCTRFPGPRTWRVVAGRPQLAMLAAATVEMNLELAQRFAAARLPAALLPSVLETAMQDFVDQVDTADPGDRMAVLWYPRTISRNALEDAVAATASLDGPLVSDATDATGP